MILPFKERFNAKIVAGTKIHSIREDKHNRWKSGIMIQFANNIRTKNYKQFMTGQCVSTQKFEIKYIPTGVPGMDRIAIYVDGRELSNEEKDSLRFNDGFDSVADFCEWFNKDYSGKIIHWTDFRY